METYPPQTPQQSAETPRKARSGTRPGVLLACGLAAGLLGGTVAATGVSLLDASGNAEATSSVGQSATEQSAQADQQSGSATQAGTAGISAAAHSASPSVVTLSVAGQSSAGSGSGIILDDQGHVLTNTHVVTLGGATADPQIEVQLDDGRVTNAEVVGTDPLSDLAVIQLEDASDLTPAELGSSEDLQVGDQAIAIGAPLGLSGTVTDGVISTVNRTITVASAEADDPEADAAPDEDSGEGFEFFLPDRGPGGTEQDQGTTGSAGSIYLNVIQTDAAINQGNSGGALTDSQGRIIGINVAIASTGGTSDGAGSIGVGFAIPIDYAQQIAEELITEGEVAHGQAGLTATDASHDAETNQSIVNAYQSNQQSPGAAASFTSGALVTEVMEGSAAEDAGLEPGDVVTEVEGRSIDSSLALTAAIREHREGEAITLTVDRDGQDQQVEATLGAMQL